MFSGLQKSSNLDDYQGRTVNLRYWRVTFSDFQAFNQWECDPTDPDPSW